MVDVPPMSLAPAPPPPTDDVDPVAAPAFALLSLTTLPPQLAKNKAKIKKNVRRMMPSS
jgi:hypothetical protein